MKNTTLLFLVKKEGDMISEICLAKGEFIRGSFSFGEGDAILDQKLEGVSAQTLG